jgi:hypothetical protein
VLSRSEQRAPQALNQDARPSICTAEASMAICLSVTPLKAKVCLGIVAFAALSALILNRRP